MNISVSRFQGEVRTPPVPLARSFERRRLRIYIAQMLTDLLCILGGFVLAGGIYLGKWPAQVALLEAQVLMPVYLTIALYQRAFSIPSLTDARFSLSRSALALAVAAALLVFITFYTRSTAFSRGAFTLALVLCFIGLTATRLGWFWLVRRLWGRSVVNVLVIEDGGPEIAMPGALRIDARQAGLIPDVSNPDRLDRFGRYVANMDRVVVSCPVDRREEWAFVLRAAGVSGEVTSEGLSGLKPLGLRDNGCSLTLVVSTGPLGIRARVTKRLFDCVLAGVMLVAAIPVIVVTALAIKLEDGGPILFVQRRLGRGNRFFNMLKFRSMRVQSADSDGNRSAARDDDRCTRVGRFIRRTSIDELPQLVNVLKGEMSIVGPRPHALGSQAGDKLFWEVDGLYWHRHSLKPGLTGLAQVRGWRGATDHASDLEARLQADLEYIATWNLGKDFWIVLRTLGVLVHSKAF